ncbi:MAG: cation:proton antiporter [Rickettsiales bacterium]|nr:MAG: cation:proton antiporter [Rickettsiales bacterium]
MIIATHIPALQILIPLFAALFAALTYNRFAAWMIATISAALGFALSIYAMPFAHEGMSYAFGGWNAPIGIEYRLDSLSQPIIVFINAILLLFLAFGRELIDSSITEYIEKKHQHLFYAILLFAHFGYLGVISTNDLFNIYVFIEISSLATYVLMSKGRTPRALVGAFDYLILGTIGATLILISIGFFLAMTGSLNITDVANILSKKAASPLITIAILFFLTGAILKMAFFPMHFWMRRAYSSAAPFMLTYLATISSIFGVYLILRFVHFTVEQQNIQEMLSQILRPIAIGTIIICTLLALKARNFKDIVVYSTAAQIGYIFMLITIEPAKHLLFQFLILDALSKVALFTIIAHIQNKSDSLNLESFASIEGAGFFKFLVALALMFSAGLPMASTFIVKIQIFDLLARNHMILEFVTVILGSVFALHYHFKLAKAVFFGSKSKHTIQIKTKSYGLAFIVLIQILTIIYIHDLASFALNTESFIQKIATI